MLCEDRYWIWLGSITGLYRKDQAMLLEKFGSPENIFNAPEGDFEKWISLKRAWVASLLKCRNEEFLENAVRRIESGAVGYVKCTDPKYPKKLKEISDYPIGLFYRGALPPQDMRMAAIIGARNCTPYGAAMARELAEMLSSLGMGIVSGMASGIDGISQKACMRNGGRSYAVLGSGVDICYPPDNADLYDALRKNGAVISEFGCCAPPLGYHFPMRNRVISGLADLVIVVEARERSGTLITVDCALDQNREVYAVPGKIGDELSAGCNHLIAQGAGIIESAEALEAELLDRYRELSKGKRKQIALAPDEELVYSNLDLSPKGIDALVGATKLSPSEVMMICMELQLRDLVTETGRNQYVRKQMR